MNDLDNNTDALLDGVLHEDHKNQARSVMRLENVVRGYRQGNREIKVLKGASLDLLPGRMTALVGPSGSGKSTLLNMAGLLESPDSGEIFIQNQPTAHLSERKRTLLRRHHIGFVFQFHRLFSEFTAKENIIIPQMLNGLSRAKAEVRAESLLAMVGLADRGEHRPGLLSGGEQQRVAIARSVANAPNILLADEPTGNLDPETAQSVFQALKKIIHGTQTAALIVTHNEHLASLMDEVLMIDQGQLIKKD